MRPRNPVDYYFLDDKNLVRVTPITDDRLRGKCSGIPECCIDFFVNEENQALRSEHIRKAKGWEYVPCADCIEKNNRVMVSNCSDKNGKNCICGAWANSKLAED